MSDDRKAALISPAVKPFAYDQTVLVLQGGGALGAYQAGAYEVLHENDIRPGWIAGISIGAINAAIIAGNAPGERVAQLKSFWQNIAPSFPGEEIAHGNPLSELSYRAMSGLAALTAGIRGMSRPWFLPPWFNPPGTPEATSFYDTAPLRQTLLDHVDFDRINRGEVRLSLGATQVRTGNFVYFDTAEKDRLITPEHVMASAALPPGFPMVHIDGEPYWDGGLVSNTPLSYVLDGGIEKDTLVFQVDLFSAIGPEPATMDEVQERIKDISYSSRTRMNTDAFLQKYRLRHAIHALAQHVDEATRKRLFPDGLPSDVYNGRVTLVHLINRSNRREIQSKDYEFWRVSIDEHWRDGMKDARTAIEAGSWRQVSDPETGLAVYDYIQTR
ncbi:MAG: patatin-like phospholipase family protein [Asticcacaulis sp.]